MQWSPACAYCLDVSRTTPLLPTLSLDASRVAPFLPTLSLDASRVAPCLRVLASFAASPCDTVLMLALASSACTCRERTSRFQERHCRGLQTSSNIGRSNNKYLGLNSITYKYLSLQQSDLFAHVVLVGVVVFIRVRPRRIAPLRFCVLAVRLGD